MGDLIASTSHLPDHLREAFGGAPAANSDLAQGVSQGYPIISYKGKNWHIVENGERMLVTRDDDSGDPASSLMGIIIRANPNLNKVYYPDGYEEGTTERPLCHSNDAIAPAPDAQEPQSKRCATCKFNQFGSRVSTDGNARGKACSDSRRLAFAPADDPERPMLLRVPAASLKNLLAYAQALDKRGVPYQALVTKVSFDPQAAYPNLLFKGESWIDAATAAKVKEMYDSDIVQTICAIGAVSDPVADEPEPGDDLLPSGGPPPATQKAKPEEVAKAVEGTAAAPKSTGFGKRKAADAPKEQPVQAQPVSEAVEVAAEGAIAELDSVLAGFDD